ncbi:MAG: type II toxin-antitoxin system RelE/ParE family toxin [Planctomycetaceae bacterium]
MSNSGSKKSVVYKRQGRTELLKAVGHYERERSGLGQRFKTAVDNCIERILEFPESGDIVAGETRTRFVKKFPYRIAYQLDGELLVIFAVARHSRDHDYWHDRIEQDDS